MKNKMTKSKIPSIFQGQDYLDPKYNTAFHALFGRDDALISFLNAALHLKKAEQIQKLEKVQHECEITINIPHPLMVRFDIHAITANGERIDIEMQRMGYCDYLDRIQIYNAMQLLNSKDELQKKEIKAKKKSKKKSSDFKNDDETLEDLKKKLTRYELPKLYSIWICDFEIPELKEIAEYRDEFSLYSKNLIHHGNLKTLTPKNSYIIYELQKFSKTANKLVTAEDKWLYILKNAGSQTIPQFTDETFAAALNRIAVNDENENLLEKQEKEIAMTEDIEYIRAQRVVAMVNAAEEKGIQQEKYSLAKGFRDKGYPLSDISQITGLTIDEIKAL